MKAGFSESPVLLYSFCCNRQLSLPAILRMNMSLRGALLVFATTLAPYASAVSNPLFLGDCFGSPALAGGAREEQERLAATREVQRS